MSYDIEKDWTTAAGLRAVIIVCKREDGRRTHRCGYVGVPDSSPLYGKAYNEQLSEISKDAVSGQTLGKRSPIIALTAGVGADDGDSVRRSPDILFDVHGGLTYSSGKSSDKYPVASTLWWFGFDCQHAGDADIEPDPRYPSFHDGEVRELPYVESECESLAAQIKAHFP